LERTLTILAAATGLRISECLGLQWQDVDFLNHRILIRRTWIDGQIGKPKTKTSGRPVPMSDLLAEVILNWKQQTPYSKPEDWVFGSTRMKGRQPRTGSVMAQSYLRPAAVRLGILVEQDKRRFGFHNLRHSLASFLVNKGTDVKTVQALLRHSNVHTTLNLYAHAMSDAKLRAQRQMMEAMKPGMVN
jgi:integrase